MAKKKASDANLVGNKEQGQERQREYPRKQEHEHCRERQQLGVTKGM